MVQYPAESGVRRVRTIPDKERVDVGAGGGGGPNIRVMTWRALSMSPSLLVAKGADIDAVNMKGNTPLHMALGYDYDDCAAFLYSAGADGTVRNIEGHPAKNGLEGDKAGRSLSTSRTAIGT